MSMRGGLFAILMLSAITAGCRDTSGESASADNVASPAPSLAAHSEEAFLPPIEVVASPKKSGEVTVRAQPAPLGSLDLPASADTAQLTVFPDEVTSFMVGRDSCDHFRGEEPYDNERRVYLTESIAELCTGSDAKLAELRRRYAHNPAVIAALRGYENQIEAPVIY